MKSMFCEIYRRNWWGDPESISGSGSSLAQTTSIRREIPVVVEQIGARSLLDAACGDFHWMRGLNLDLECYIGIDIVPELIARNEREYGGEKRRFLVADLTTGSLPRADVILCRDCLVHFRLHDILRAIENFKRSGSAYLLTTTFPKEPSNSEVVTGGWRPVNLELPPFNFPKPIRLINEQCTEVEGQYADKSLGLWKLEDLLAPARPTADGSRRPQAAPSRRRSSAGERIFVQIASYRDSELRWTIQDLFEKAARPERISVGVCLQVEPETDQDCELPDLRPEQVRCVRHRAQDSRGACWARHEAQKLWAGEEFTLQIDSHMRFERDWDDRLLVTLRACPSEKAVLSTYPPGCIPPDILHVGYYILMVPSCFDEWGTLRLGSLVIPLVEAPAAPILGAFCAGSFFFGPARIIADVPYDPHLYFYGEEITFSARLWTHGWDIYHPNTTLLYHCWHRDYRPRHWDDVAHAMDLDVRSRRRVNHLLGVEPSR